MNAVRSLLAEAATRLDPNVWSVGFLHKDLVALGSADAKQLGDAVETLADSLDTPGLVYGASVVDVSRIGAEPWPIKVLQAAYVAMVAARINRDTVSAARDGWLAVESLRNETAETVASYFAALLAAPMGPEGHHTGGAPERDDPRWPGIRSRDSRDDVSHAPGSVFIVTDIVGAEWGGMPPEAGKGNAGRLLPIIRQWQSGGISTEVLVDRCFQDRVDRERLVIGHLNDISALSPSLFAVGGDGLEGTVSDVESLLAGVTDANSRNPSETRSIIGAAPLLPSLASPTWARRCAQFAMHALKVLRSACKDEQKLLFFYGRDRIGPLESKAVVEYLISAWVGPPTSAKHHEYGAQASVWAEEWILHLDPVVHDHWIAHLPRSGQVVETSKNHEVVILLGAPASGKTTYCRNNFAEEAVVSLDRLRGSLGLLPASDASNTLVASLAVAQVRIRLSRGQTTVLDSTGVHPGLTDDVIEAALSANCPVRFVYFATSLVECLHRNESRGAGMVPEAALRRLWGMVVDEREYRQRAGFALAEIPSE